MADRARQQKRAGLYVLLIGVFALGAAVAAWIRGAGGRVPITVEGPKDDHPTPSTKPDKPDAIAKNDKPRILAAFLSRRGPVPFRQVTRYDKVPVPFNQVPGDADVAEALALAGQKVPPYVFRVDQVTESMTDTLGLKTHSKVSYKAYLNRYDGKVVAFDIAITDGGIPQQLLGRLNKKGVMVEIYRGGKKIDQNEQVFPAKTSIMPVELGFIHEWYQKPENKDYKKRVQWVFFVPEAMTFIRLIVSPPTWESLAHRGQIRPCAKYEVFVTSMKALEGVYSRQEIWFDARTCEMLKRVDYEEGVAENELVVTEQVDLEVLETLQPLVIRPSEVPAKKCPYPLDQDLVYDVSARDKHIGQIRIRFKKREASEGVSVGYESSASVDFEMAQQSYRRERAMTWYDEHFLPLKYSAGGKERAEAEAEYELSALFEAGHVSLNLSKKTFPPEEGASPTHPQIMTLHPPHPRQDPPSIPKEEAWTPPLRMVWSEEEGDEEKEAPLNQPRIQNEHFERPLTRGTFVYDFNRVEHLAAVAFHFDLPPVTGAAGADPATGFQKVAFFSVRQNKAGVLLFAIHPEPKLELPQVDSDELLDPLETLPQLYYATTSGALLPCTMLLAPDGRLLQLTSRYGSSEVTYTLQDPLMRKRASRNQKLRGQKGPRLLRPPWY